MILAVTEDTASAERMLAETADILGTVPAALPWNLVRTPHSSAFCSQYVKMCLKELKDEGLV